MGSMAVAHRYGMDFDGDITHFTFGIAGKSMDDVKDFCNLMWGGAQKGDIAVLKDGIYYVCDGVDPDTGAPFTDQQIAEIERHFDEGAVTFL
jgi:hypothetical protein